MLLRALVVAGILAATPAAAHASVQANLSASGAIVVTGDNTDNIIQVSIGNATNSSFWPSIAVSSNTTMAVTGDVCDGQTCFGDGSGFNFCLTGAGRNFSCLLNNLATNPLSAGQATFSVTIDGKGGNDTLSVDATVASPSGLSSVRVVGGPGNDKLTVRGSHLNAGIVQPAVEPDVGDDVVELAPDLGATVDLGDGNDVARLLNRIDGAPITKRTTVTGGDGVDAFVDDSRDAHTLTTTGTGDHALSGVEEIFALHPRSGALTITGSNADELLVGRGSQAGLATINGGGGHDVLVDAETAVLSGGDGDDVLVGCVQAVTGIGSYSAGKSTDPSFVRGGVYCQPSASTQINGQHNLLGGIGDDLLIGGTNGDNFDGGDGTDLASAQGHRGSLIPNTTTFEGVVLDFSVTPPRTVHMGNADLGFTAMEGFEGSVFADAFTGGPGADNVRGGPVLTANDANLRAIVNSAGDGDGDILDGGGGDDVLDGGRGDDMLYGKDGVDLLIGGIGDDTYLVGGGTAAISDEATNTRADGTPQLPDAAIADPSADAPAPRIFHGDTVSYTEAAGPVSVDDGAGFLYKPSDTTGSQPLVADQKDFWDSAQIEIVEGSPGNDLLVGSPRAEQLLGGEGADVIRGGDGDDQLDEGPGSGASSPLTTPGLDGGAGDDELLGGAGDDLLLSSAGDDLLDCGGGEQDRVSYAAATAGVTVTANAVAGDDGPPGEHDTVTRCVQVAGSSQADDLTAGPELTVLEGGEGNDTLRGGKAGAQLSGDAGSDRLIPVVPGMESSALVLALGGPGIADQLDLSNAPTAVTVRETADSSIATEVAGGGVKFDTLEVEEVTGTAFSDELTMLDASSASQVLRGGGGEDFVDGGGGNDSVFGEESDDRVRGGPGVDAVTGDAGTDDFRLGDGETDFSDCGPGERASTVDPGLDVVDAGCELGAVVAQPPPPLAPIVPDEKQPVIPLAPLAAQGSGSPSDIGGNGRVGADGTTTVTLICNEPAGCNGTAELSTSGAATRAAAARTVLGRATYRLRKGQKKQLKVKLGAKARKLLKKRKRIRATLRIIPAGGGKVQTKAITLRVAPRRRG